MRSTSVCGVAFAAAAIFSATLPAASAFAAASDYRFDLVSVRAAGPNRTDVMLRLTHIADANPVPGAVIFQPRAVMAGMEGMPAEATVEPGQQPGTYLLHVATAMAGPWTLRMSAKVQGEAETVRSAVAFEAGQ
ncbi:MAG: FixH family protein [Acetobacteraceae bacterium]|nr:FixH family protein [Acetobacteraceae bacterium]